MAQKLDITKIDGKSLDIEAVDKEKLKAVFPQCFSEGKLDIDKLLSLCGEYIDNDFEKYKFEWKGKSECYKIAGKRSTGTLRPCVQESVDFENTNNLYIEGDNLEVLKLLQNAYYRKVKMIYIDPPYNTGNDFVYEDDFKDPLVKYKEITSQTTKSNPETMGRYHTNWLNMMYPRLRLAANLLRDDGVIFISIDDNEVTNLRKLCDEVFGEENFRNIIATRRYDKNLNRQFMENGLMTMNTGLEYVLVYSKSPETKLSPVFKPSSDERAVQGYWKGFWNDADRPTMRYDVLGFTPETGQWKWKKELADEAVKNYEEYKKNFADRMSLEEYWEQTGKVKKFIRRNLEGKGKNKGVEHWVAPANGILRNSNWSDILASKPTGVDIPFDSPKNADLLVELIKLSDAEDSDIILDFFSGSATTAHAVMQLNAEDGGNRQFIMVQLPELTDEKSEAYKAGYKNICEIGKERIRRAGAKIKAEEMSKISQKSGASPDLVNLGIVSSFDLGSGCEATYKNNQTKTFSQNGENQKLLDTGFKVFKLDTSNLVKWDDTPILDNNTQDLFTRMDNMVESIKTDRTELDVVYEVMLKLGIPVTYKIFETQVNGRKVYSIGEGGLVLVCLDKSNGGITPEDITAMCDLAPAKIVAAENAFKDDVALSNAYYISKDKGIEIELL